MKLRLLAAQLLVQCLPCDAKLPNTLPLMGLAALAWSRFSHLAIWRAHRPIFDS